MNQYSVAAPITDQKGEGQETHPLASGVLSGCGGCCISQLFSPKDFTVATQVVRKNGGTIATPPSARYLLAPLVGVYSRQKGAERKREEVEGTAVTMMWLVG